MIFEPTHTPNFKKSSVVCFFLVVIPAVAVLAIESQLNNADGNEYFDHAVTHSAMATIIFVTVTLFVHITSLCFGKLYMAPVAGVIAAIMFYVSREIRDYNKGYKPVSVGRTKIYFANVSLGDLATYLQHIDVPNWSDPHEFVFHQDLSNACTCLKGRYQSFDYAGVVTPSLCVTCILVVLCLVQMLASIQSTSNIDKYNSY